MKIEAKEFTDILQNGLREFLEGTQEDIRLYANQIALNAQEVAQEPDPVKREKLLKEVLGQARTLAETSRVRAVNQGWKTVNGIISVAIRLLITASLPGEAKNA